MTERLIEWLLATDNWQTTMICFILANQALDWINGRYR